MNFLKFILILVSLLTVACSSSDKTVNNKKTKKTFTNVKKETKDNRYNNDPLVSSYDVNKDSIADMWKIYKNVKSKDEMKKLLSRREIDLNFDGKVNYYKFYTEKGNINMEYLDLDLDGIVDTVVYYEKNQITKQEQYKKNPINKDLTINKEVPVYKRYLYVNKKLSRVISDREGNGVLDQYLFFKKNKLIQIAFDDDEDGKIDTRVKLKEKKNNKQPLKETQKNDK